MKKNLKKIISANLLLIPSMIMGCSSQIEQIPNEETSSTNHIEQPQIEHQEPVATQNDTRAALVTENNLKQTDLLTEVLRLIDEEKEKRLIKSDVEFKLSMAERPILTEQAKEIMRLRSEVIYGHSREEDAVASESVSTDDIALLKLNNKLKMLELALAEDKYDLQYKIDLAIAQKQAALKAKIEQFTIANTAEMEKDIARSKEALYAQYDTIEIEEKIAETEAQIENINNGDTWEDE